MSFSYPRRVAIHRPGKQTGVGAVSYGGQTLDEESAIACDLPASIQERREGSRNPIGLPGSGTMPTWYIYIPKRSARLGLILDRDIVIDDIGVRYQVIAAYWDSMGFRLTAQTLES